VWRKQRLERTSFHDAKSSVTINGGLNKKLPGFGKNPVPLRRLAGSRAMRDAEQRQFAFRRAAFFPFFQMESLRTAGRRVIIFFVDSFVVVVVDC